MDMTFYCTKESDGTIHVQNAVMGMMGQHHVHTQDDFDVWSKGSEDSIEWLTGDCDPCACGLKAGGAKSGR